MSHFLEKNVNIFYSRSFQYFDNIKTKENSICQPFSINLLQKDIFLNTVVALVDIERKKYSIIK